MIPSCLSIALFASLAAGPVTTQATSADHPATALVSAPIANTGDDGKAQKDRAERREKSREKANKDDDKSKSGARKIQSFSAKDMDGKKIDFPSDFKGKIVMLDFWATWCGPCMAEMPHVVSAYEKFHEQGFEVVGVTLDNKGAESKIKKVEEERGMTWPQIFSGKGWEAPLAKKFSIRSIPQAFLVDGDTGEILADGAAMRGNALSASIESAIARKAENQKDAKGKKKDDQKDKKDEAGKDARKDGTGDTKPEGEKKKDAGTADKPAGSAQQ